MRQLVGITPYLAMLKHLFTNPISGSTGGWRPEFNQFFSCWHIHLLQILQEQPWASAEFFQGWAMRESVSLKNRSPQRGPGAEARWGLFKNDSAKNANLPRRPPWTDLHQIWHSGSPRRSNHPWQFFGNRLRGFESVRGRILPFSHL